MPINACVIAPQATVTKILDCIKTDTAYKEVVSAFQQGKHLTDLPEDHPARHLKQVWGQLSLSDDGILIVDGTNLLLLLL